jgi:hypothetical protein
MRMVRDGFGGVVIELEAKTPQPWQSNQKFACHCAFSPDLENKVYSK